METEFSLSQAVASGDAFEHRPSERGHCVEDFSAELNLRDLPGEAAGFEFGADDALPTTNDRIFFGMIHATRSMVCDTGFGIGLFSRAAGNGLQVAYSLTGHAGDDFIQQLPPRGSPPTGWPEADREC